MNDFDSTVAMELFETHCLDSNFTPSMQDSAAEGGQGGNHATYEIEEGCSTQPDIVERAEISLEHIFSSHVLQDSEESMAKMRHSEYQGSNPPVHYQEYLARCVRYTTYHKGSETYLNLVMDEEIGVKFSFLHS